ncbi:MAG: glycoside hydrolase family 3 N-terminal domain-containing protein [Candidatus Cryptobacteroides sp.]|nr:glycoside hydrolase family 3 N-terminal domain-containing protein [Candidatus Cryptobacteroides sp.]
MKRTKILFLSLLAVLACSRQAGTTTGSTPEVEARVDKLLSQMTLQEKIGQMNQISAGGDVAQYAEALRAGQIGSILNEVDPEKINEYQRLAVEESRLGIPLLVSRDVIHGFHTLFPIPLGLAATFDPELVEEGARIAAIEATAQGIRWTFSPMLDIARDPRWGRIAEGSGEDTYLDARMGEAMVRGYQGNLADSTSMAACIKHFVGYGAAEGGRDYNSTYITERQLRNVYLPPFEAAVKAGALTLMTSFNDNDGVPSTGNTFVVKDILRGEWGFDGLVVTDWNSMGEMIAHGFGEDRKDVAGKAVKAGVDMDMMTFGFISHLEELVRSGAVKESAIDQAVRNILRVKVMLGLFEHPYVDVAAGQAVQYAPEHLAAAQKTAEESAILLKNAGVLPLKAGVRMLVTGPLADAPHDQLGTWSFDGEKEHTVTPLKALQARFPGQVTYVPGLRFSREKRERFDDVLAAARHADVVLAFVGEEAILSGEAHSLADLNLKGSQSELLQALRSSGKPVVAVVMAGRPLTIERDLPNCDALLYSFHPGTMGGPALANLLFGDVVPSGKTPVTFLRTAGQAPMYYNHNMTGRPFIGGLLLDDIPLEAGQTSLGNTSYYLDYGAYPLFPFGYGLSYTTFAYSDIRLDKGVYGKDDVMGISFTLTNTGACEGTEIAQVYVRDLVGSVTRPVKELKAFERITLAPGESRTVTLSLPVSELAFYGLDMVKKVEPGDFQLWVAGDSASGEALSFKVK